MARARGRGDQVRQQRIERSSVVVAEITLTNEVQSWTGPALVPAYYRAVAMGKCRPLVLCIEIHHDSARYLFGLDDG